MQKPIVNSINLDALKSANLLLQQKECSSSLPTNSSIVYVAVLIAVIFPKTGPAELMLANFTLHMLATAVFLY